MKSLNKKGISPVIATVIIVSVAIAIAVAVAFWMTGITGLFTRYEKIEVTNVYAIWNETKSKWLVVLQIKNSGSDSATIDDIFINVKPMSAYGTSLTVNYTNQRTSPTNFDYNTTKDWRVFPSGGITINPGEEYTIVIGIPTSGTGFTFTHGQSIEIKLHTVAGKEYPKTVVLP